MPPPTRSRRIKGKKNLFQSSLTDRVGLDLQLFFVLFQQTEEFTGCRSTAVEETGRLSHFVHFDLMLIDEQRADLLHLCPDFDRDCVTSSEFRLQMLNRAETDQLTLNENAQTMAQTFTTKRKGKD
jgi:hypothetical protein